MDTTTRTLLRLACVVVVMLGLCMCMELYGSHYRSITHDTIAQRKAMVACIDAGGSADACSKKYDGPPDQCADALSWSCFATIFKADGE